MISYNKINWQKLKKTKLDMEHLSREELEALCADLVNDFEMLIETSKTIEYKRQQLEFLVFELFARKE